MSSMFPPIPASTRYQLVKYMNEVCPVGSLVIADERDSDPWTAFIVGKWTWSQDHHQLMAEAIVWDREKKLHPTIKRWCVPCYNTSMPTQPYHPRLPVSFWKIIRLEDQS